MTGSLGYARHGDTLAIVRLDRLGRSLTELLTTVTMLKERGIALLGMEEKIDTSSAARAKGKQPGRRPLDADRVASALRLVAAGLSPTAAARQLGLGRSTVDREVSRAGGSLSMSMPP